MKKILSILISVLLCIGCITLMKNDILPFWTATASCLFGISTLYLLKSK